MFSIITVCYNAEKCIEKTIASVLKQNYHDYEYIFIDGNSTDRTLNIINHYKNEFEKIGIPVKVVSEKDQGIYDAMNKGVQLTSGDWINFLNAGDCLFDADVLQNVNQSIMSEKADIYVGSVVWADKYLGQSSSHQPLEKLMDEMIFCHQGIYASRKMFSIREFDIGYKYSADYDWLLSLYVNGHKFQYMDFLVAIYDMNGVSFHNQDAIIKEVHEIKKKNGCLTVREEAKKVNWKYKIYKFVANRKFPAMICYKLFREKLKGIYWIGDDVIGE